MHELFTKLIADGLVFLVVAIGAWTLLTRIPKDERYHAYCRILMAGLTALLVAKLVASIYQPEVARPFEQMGVKPGAAYLNNPGFPSDHVLFCMAILLAVWFETKHKKITYILIGLTALVAIGRVLALVHTPLDVIGGVGIACAGIPWYLQREKHKQKHLVKETRTKHKKRVQ
jgi:membrane-associated phospholipid phosphatase